MARSTSWPFLSAAEATGAELAVYPHTTEVEGRTITTQIAWPRTLPDDDEGSGLQDLLQICKGDQNLVIKLFCDGYKLKVNALVRGPLAKELREQKERDDAKAQRRIITKVWMRQNMPDQYNAHASNGIDEYADVVYDQHRAEIRAAFKGMPCFEK